MLSNPYIRFLLIQVPKVVSKSTFYNFRNKTLFPFASEIQIHRIQKERKPILIPTLRSLLFNAYVSNSILHVHAQHLLTGLQVPVPLLSFFLLFSLQYSKPYLDTKEKIDQRNRANGSEIVEIKAKTKQLLPKTSVSKCTQSERKL